MILKATNQQLFMLVSLFVSIRPPFDCFTNKLQPFDQFALNIVGASTTNKEMDLYP